jgi:cell division protease FtsH
VGKHAKKMLVGLALTLAALAALFVLWPDGERREPAPQATLVSIGTLERLLDAGQVRKLSYRPLEQSYYAELADGTLQKAAALGAHTQEEIAQKARLAETPIEVVNGGPSPAGGGGFSDALTSNLGFISIAIVLPALFAAMLVLMWMQMRGGRGMKIAPSTSTVSFSDVAGCGEVVEELADIRNFLSDPDRYAKAGARVPKGVLLYGPPGTGKTLVAKAVASEAGAPFYAVSGSEFVEMFAGLGAARIRKLFREAKRRSPAIVFIDEIDAVGRARGGASDGGAREADQTLNQLLTEMDGFEVTEHPVIVIAACNRPDVLDKALLRPGRFDRHIAVDPPDRAGRLAVLTLHAKGKRLHPDVSLAALAEKTSGMSGAELANILNEAALQAARRGDVVITPSDIEEGFVRAVAGARKQNRALCERERLIVAYHEAGHALAAELLDCQQKVQQVSIVPRGRSAGHMIFSDEEDVFLHSRSELLDRLTITLAGRAAEEIVVGDVTSGAGDDLQKATQLATSMVARLGMGQTLGLYALREDEELSERAREEVRSLLAERYQAARSLLAGRRALLERVAQALLAEETLDRARFLELLADGCEAPAAASGAAPERSRPLAQAYGLRLAG